MYFHGQKLYLAIGSLIFAFLLFALDHTIVATILLTVGNKFKGFDKISWVNLRIPYKQCRSRCSLGQAFDNIWKKVYNGSRNHFI